MSQDPTAGGQGSTESGAGGVLNGETGGGEGQQQQQQQQQGEGQQQQQQGEGQQQQQQGEGQVPESYSMDSIQMPEGMELDTATAESFSEIAKEAGMSQETFDKVASFYAKQKEAEQQQLTEFFDTRDEQRMSELKDDKEIGGENMKAAHLLANRVLKTFDTDGKLTEYLGAAREANNPDLVRFLVKVGNAISDDRLVGGEKQADNSNVPDYMKMGWTFPK